MDRSVLSKVKPAVILGGRAAALEEAGEGLEEEGRGADLLVNVHAAVELQAVVKADDDVGQVDKTVDG